MIIKTIDVYVLCHRRSGQPIRVDRSIEFVFTVSQHFNNIPRFLKTVIYRFIFKNKLIDEYVCVFLKI